MNDTLLEPWVAPKPAPTIVIGVPTEPNEGLRPEMTGAVATVNKTPLLVRPPAVTTTFPVAAPEGTCTEMLVGVHV